MSSEAPGPQNNSSFSQGRKILRDNANRRLDLTQKRRKIIEQIVTTNYPTLGNRAAVMLATRKYEDALEAITERLAQENPNLSPEEVKGLAEQELVGNTPSLKALIGNIGGLVKKNKNTIKKVRDAKRVASAFKLSNPVGWVWLAFEFLIFTKTGRKVFLVLSLCLCCCCILFLGALSSFLQFRVENLGYAIENSPTLIYCAGGQNLVEQTTCMFEQKSEEYLQDVYTDEEQN